MINLKELFDEHTGTKVSWLVRRPSTGNAFGGGENDELAGRGALGAKAKKVVEVIVPTGFRPDLSILTEVRLDLESVPQAPRDLAPLIDPDVHSCGTV